MFERIGTVLERMLDKERARVPFRGNSYQRGYCEGMFWRKTNRQEVRRILFAAKRYELVLRRKGRRCGPLDSVAIEVLEYFVNLVDFRTGRLEPSIGTLMRRLKRSRDAVVRALNNLRRHGFLYWIRRYEPTGNEGRGPQVRQATNAYRLSLPERAKQLLGWRGLPEPLPEDYDHAQEVRQTKLATYERSLSLEKWALSAFGDTPLGRAYARLGRNIERESVRQAESRSESIKPAPE